MKRMSTLLLLVIAVAALFGQFNSENVDYISAISTGPALTHIIHDNYAYVASGMHVNVLDLSDPSSPVLVGSFITPYEIFKIKAYENLLITANERFGFSIYDISDPLSPEALTTVDTPMDAFDIAVHGNFLYVSASWRIYIYDIENPSEPELVFQQSVSGECGVVDIIDDNLYIDYASSGIMIYDITTPDTLVETRYWDFTNPKDIDIYGDYVFTISYSSVEGMKVWDTSSPDTTVNILHVDGTRSASIDIEGDYLAYSTGDEVYIFDISAVPIIDTVAYFPDYTSDAEVTLLDGYLYLSERNSGFISIDISDIASPAVSGTVELGRTPLDICIVDSILIASYEPDIVKIYNIADIHNPIELSTYTADDRPLFGEVKDNYLILAVNSSGLEIVDISDLEAPVLHSSFDLNSYFYSMDIGGDFVYIGAQSNRLYIVDISDISTPVEALDLSVAGNIYGLDIVDEYAYIAKEWSGFDIYDMTDPYVPVLVSTTDFSAQVRGLKVFNNFAYITTLFNGYTAIDITDRSSPEIAGEYYIMGFNDGIEVDSNHVYMSRIAVYDNSDPYDSEELGHFELSATTRDIIKYGDYFVVANQDNGVLVFQYNEIVPMEYDVILNTGWNILSYPFESSMELTTLPDILIGNAFNYNSVSRDYSESTLLSAGVGSWVLSTADSFFHVEASDPVESIVLDIYPGWNLVGGNASAMPASFFDSYAEILTPIYNYNSGSRSYDEADSLRPFKGYWILATDSVTISIE